MESLFVILFIAGVCSAVGYSICSHENKATGAILGAILGPFGILLAVLLDKKP